MTDLTLRGGIVYDGTGGPPRRADVAVTGDAVSALGEHLPAAGRVIELDGLAVAPGFIDLHSHSDVALHHDGRAEAKVRQGITLELLGQDGLGCAPLDPWQEDVIKSLLAGWVYPEALERPWPWRTVREYLQTLERQGVSQNVAALVPHGLVRHRYLGLENRPPTDDELTAMRNLVAEALDDGAFGLSSGLIYLPCVFADRTELIELCRPVADAGGIFDVHVRTYGSGLVTSIQEAAEICAASGARLHLCHYNVFGRDNWPLLEEAYEVLDRVGITVSGDQHAYEAASTSLGAAALPPWVTKDGAQRMIELLSQPETRARVRDEMSGRCPADWDNWVALAGWDGVIVSFANAVENTDAIGRSLAETAAERSVEPAEATIQIAIADAAETNTPFSVTVLCFVSNDDVASRIMRDRRWGIGTDALLVKGLPHPRCFGTFPRVIAKFVRELNVLSMEQAICKMSGRAAEILGLPDRGRIGVGTKADLVVFDPQRIADTATYTSPRSFPEGIPYVFVNGTPVIDEGEHTGATPGSAVFRNG